MSKSFWNGFFETISLSINLVLGIYWIVAAIQYNQDVERVGHTPIVCAFIICALFFLKLAIDNVTCMIKK